MRMPDEVVGGDDVEAALLRGAEAAIEAAARIRATSAVVTALSADRRESRMTARCAWCGRFRIGERWLVVESMPVFADHAQITHGICEDCVEALRSAGMSV